MKLKAFVKARFFGSVEKKGSPGGVHKHVVVLFLMRCVLQIMRMPTTAQIRLHKKGLNSY